MATPSDAELVARARAGDHSAFGALYDNWFDRVYDLAFRVVRDANAAADVAQDTFLSAWRELDGLSDPGAFGGWVRRIARNTAFNHRRKDQRAGPVDAETMAVIEAAGPSVGAPAGLRVEDRLGTADDPARAAEDSELAGLVWEAADALGERDSSVLDLQLRHDMTPAEIAEVVGITRNHANQLVHRVRNRLGDALRARVLWRGGDPACAELRTALVDAGITRFGPDAVRVATVHAEDCEECSERRRLRLAPAALFSATPFLIAPSALKTRIADALVDDGVPMDGSTYKGRRRPRWRSRRALAAAAAVAVVVTGAVVTARAVTDGGDSGPVPAADEAALQQTTTTTTTAPPAASAPTETTALPAPTTPIAPGPEGGPPIGLNPAPGPAGPPAPPVVTATLSVTPSSKQSPYPNDGTAPVLQWSTSGGASVMVSGPGFSSTAPSGTSPRLCPTSSAAAWSVCSAAGGYTYTLTVRDGGGAVVAQRSATLTVSP